VVGLPVCMEPPVKMEENVGKVVGRRTKLPEAFATGMGLQSLAAELHKSFEQHWAPRGVYRFKTHEEAEEWMWRMLARSQTPRT
jgi:hypothetical protein